MTLRPLFIAFLFTGAVVLAQTTPIDPDHPSAIARADDILVEARLNDDTIASGETIGVTYDVHNLTDSAIAIADKSCSASYDGSSRTVTLSIGSEVPESASIRRLAIIPPGIAQRFTTGALLHLLSRGPSLIPRTPRYVEIRTASCATGVRKPSAVIGDLFEKWWTAMTRSFQRLACARPAGPRAVRERRRAPLRKP